MSDRTITIRRSYVAECERFWREARVKWTHNKMTNAETLTSVSDAQSYIRSSSRSWDLNNSVKIDRMFIDALCANCESAGNGFHEYITHQYCAGSQQGCCKFILVVFSNIHGKITVGYSYHDIEEDIRGSNSVYSEYAGAKTIDWLKSKSMESLREILPSSILPYVNWV